MVSKHESIDVVPKNIYRQIDSWKFCEAFMMSSCHSTIYFNYVFHSDLTVMPAFMGAILSDLNP